MSYIGNISDIECEKSESNRIRTSNLVTKAQANKLSSEPKWTTKRGPDSDSEVSTTDNFLTKGINTKHLLLQNVVCLMYMCILISIGMIF